MRATAERANPAAPWPRRKPRALPPGGVVGVAAPSGAVDPERLDRGVRALEAAGFEVVLAPGLRARRGYLAGEDAQRAAGLQALLEDPRVGAVLCARGGYGAMRILPSFRPERAAVWKPFVGFSDLTALHLACARAGLVSFHGPVVEAGEAPEEAVGRAALLRAITDRRPLGELAVPAGTTPPRVFHPGRAEGPLVGGNLTLLAATLGTPWEVDARGALLLLEDTHEEPYRLDRLLTQLALAGTLQEAAGFVLGGFTDCEPEGEGPGPWEVVAERLVPLGKPCAGPFALGHGPVRLTVPLGVTALLDADADPPILSLPEPALA